MTRGLHPDWELNFDSAPFCNGRLHLGHVRNYSLGDVRARWLRRKKVHVEYASAFDAFGLPNEQAAQKAGLPANEFVAANAREMGRQYKALSLSYDRQPLRSYADPAYYGWTQWLFLQFWQRGLVYRQQLPLPYCRSCESFLALAEIKDGLCTRCNTEVVAEQAEQWFVRTSDYAERLFAGIETLDGWSERCKNIHRAYMGRMAGRSETLEVRASDQVYTLKVFAPHEIDRDGACIALRMDHALGMRIRARGPDGPGQESWARWRRRSDDRKAEPPPARLELIGESLGLIPVPYGEVPEGYDALLTPRGAEENDAAMSFEARLLDVENAIAFRIQDWLVSRSRSWGTPLPAVNCQDCGIQPVDEGDLPVLLSEHGGTGRARCGVCSAVEPCVSRTLDCFMDDCWCFFGTVPEWDLAGNPFEAWRRRPASRVHFHTGYDTYVYPHFFRFAGYFLYDLGLTPREEPIDFFPGHDVVTLDGRKLSKSHENAPDLDELLETWGADVVRLSVLSGSNPDREMAWSDGRLEHGRRMLRTIRELDALKAACPDDADHDPGGLAPTHMHTLERIDGFVDTYRVGAAIDLLYKASVGALRTGRNEKSAQLGLLCNELLSWWRIFVPAAPA